MYWKSRSWILIGVLLAAFTAARAQIVTTQVADTIYHADGTPATGTALISWPEFTTAGGDVIPTGSTSATIAAGGALSVQLTPNAGATPIGTYYTVVYHLDDGTVSRQYWVVPVSAAPVKVSAIESTVLPTSIAMQTVSKSYVDTAIATAITGHPLDANPYVLKAGDTMTGPLLLPADPVSAGQAADKNYVDEAVAASTGGLGQKISIGGDLGGTATAAIVTGIQGNPVAATAPAIGQTLTWNGAAYAPTPALSTASTNPPSGGNDAYSPIPLTLTQTAVSGDNGDASQSPSLLSPACSFYAPGWDYGNPGYGATGWFLPACQHAFVNDYSAGIGGYINLDQAVYAKPGDINLFDAQVNVKPSWIAASDQGVSFLQEGLKEMPPYSGTVVTGGTGATTLTVSCTGSCASISLNTPVIDTTAGVVTGATFTPTGGGAVSGTVAGTSSWTNTGYTSGTLATAVNVPRTVNNATLQLSASSVTVNFNVTTAIATGELCEVLIPSGGGGEYEEVVKPTAVGTPSGGVQSVTAIFHYSHPVSSVYYCGGPVGTYIEIPANTVGGYRYVDKVFGATGANTIVAGHQVANGFANIFSGSSPVSVNTYQGADAVGVVNPGTSRPDGTYFALEANNAAWNASDAIEDLNNAAANWSNDYRISQVYNPYAQRLVHQDGWVGYGGGLNNFSGWAMFSGGQGTFAGMSGGTFHAPSLLSARYAVSNGIALQYAPVAGAGQEIGNFAPNCGGFLLCIGSGPIPGATSQVEGIFNEGDGGGAITYNHANQYFYLQQAGHANDTIVTAGYGNFTAAATIATAASDHLILTGGATQNGLQYAAAAGADGFYTFNGVYISNNGFGWFDISRSSFDGMDMFLNNNGHATFTNKDIDCGNWMCGGGLTTWGVLGFSSTSAATGFDTGLSRDSAGAVDVGNGTAGNKSGTINAATGNFTSGIATGSYLGPATAPTGSCPTNGAWVFSQDGHASFCAAGAWTTKI
jgi:hypothetical protein